MRKKLLNKFEKNFESSPFNIIEIDELLIKITKNKYPKVKILSKSPFFFINRLIYYLKKFGSYWIREVPPLSLIYKREELIYHFLDNNLKECGIIWNAESSLNITHRRESNVIKRADKYLEQCNLN